MGFMLLRCCMAAVCLGLGSFSYKGLIDPTGIYSLGVGAPPHWTADKPLMLTAWRVWPGLRRCVDA